MIKYPAIMSNREQTLLDQIDSERALIVAQRGTIKDLLAALRETFAALEDSESLSSDEFFRLRAQFRNVIAQAEVQS